MNAARDVHGNIYNYSKVNYVNSHTPICVICPIHGEFWVLPYGHLDGRGCPTCGRQRSSSSRRMKKDEFIRRAKEVHADKYDYSKVEYVNNTTKVRIICPIHGEFIQTPKNHLRGCGCHKCGKCEKDTLETFVEKARKVHGNKYDYTDVLYRNSQKKVSIRCRKCGRTFLQVPASHIGGHGCPHCAAGKINIKRRSTRESFIRNSILVHGGKYNYSKVLYVNRRTSVCIICPTHGIFYQTPASHLSGHGCPHCYKSRGEIEVANTLDEYGIDYVCQHTIGNESIFCQNKVIKVDFYLPTHNTIIEYQGVQHYRPIKRFGGKEKYEKQKERDFSVRTYCHNHKIKLIEIPYTQKKKIKSILKEKLNIK